jgi:hypothetical protein
MYVSVASVAIFRVLYKNTDKITATLQKQNQLMLTAITLSALIASGKAALVKRYFFII